MKTSPIATFLLLGTLAACSTTEPTYGSPRSLAGELADLVVTGEAGAADDLFAAYEDDARYRQEVYPALFDIAEEHYDTGSAGDAISIMRFVVAHYPNSLAAQEGLLYSLLVHRAETGEVSRTELDEMGDLVRGLESNAQKPEWVHLAATYYWIDRERPEAAAESYAAFEAAWDGRPSYLEPDLVEIERWLETHG